MVTSADSLKRCNFVARSLVAVLVAGSACSSNGGGSSDGNAPADSRGADVLCYSNSVLVSDAGIVPGPCYPACSTQEDCASLAISGDECQTGYSCLIPFVKGPLACLPFCTCKDFIKSNTPTVPSDCLTDGGRY
jgi:hypothetical protein